VDGIGEQWGRLTTFFKDVWAELKRTSWPNRKEVESTTVVVVVFVLICAAYLFVVDVVLRTGMERLFRTFGR
jgi:preprotein translocase subunit SecE